MSLVLSYSQGKLSKSKLGARKVAEHVPAAHALALYLDGSAVKTHSPDEDLVVRASLGAGVTEPLERRPLSASAAVATFSFHLADSIPSGLLSAQPLVEFR
jgi:hypothetical protein